MLQSDSKMELSKEVHGLLDRIKRMSQQSQNYENLSDIRSVKNTSYIERNQDTLMNSFSGSFCENEDLIPTENMDFSDEERWLYISENVSLKPYMGDLKEWLRQDFNKINNYSFSFPRDRDYDRFDSKKMIDTRTFTRPKKRISRPSIEQFAEGYFHDNSRTGLADCFSENSSKSSVSDFLSESNSQSESTNSLGNVLNTSGPVNFKLSEPVYNSSFDRILATAKNCIDSFQNMSPPSLINSLCSSSMIDSTFINPDHVPNICNDVTTCVPNETMSVNENEDPNATCSIELPKNILTEKNITYTEPTSNETYDRKVMNKTIDVINSTYSKSPESALNATYQKNINNRTTSFGFGYHNLSGTNTITKKPKHDKLSNSLKSSCPDINRTFRKGHDYALDETFQKLSDSQPNLSEDLKRTIYNQSMELMHPVIETYGSARSGSADSLDERSSSISTSSKDSGTKIMNIDDLDGLAKMQEQSLHQVMSTPKPVKPSNMLLWEEDALSPIQNRLVEDLSDSDTSDSYTTARNGYSKRNTMSAPVTKSCLNTTRSIPNNAEVSQSTLRTVPTMIVKPLEVSKTIVPPNRSQSGQLVRPKIRASGLPRPSGIPTTGIPRPMSRIPGPKTTRLQLSRPVQRPPPKVDGWMDGCY